MDWPFSLLVNVQKHDFFEWRIQRERIQRGSLQATPLHIEARRLSLVVGSYRIENGKGICEEMGTSILVAEV